MTIRTITLLCFLMLAAQPAVAATATVSEFASILIKLEHYPSATEKSRLQEIAASSNSNEQEKVLANAIANLSHAAADADKAKLKQLMGDAAAPTELRDLAGIILNLNHKPSASDKEKLKHMMK